MNKLELEDILIVGAVVVFGKEWSEYHECSYIKPGQEIELIEGHFENDNGLYETDETAPSILLGDGEYDSIYHLFGNDLEMFMDCKIKK